MVEKELRKQELLQATIEELHSARYQEYFQHFHPQSVELFINAYSQKRAQSLVSGPLVEQQQQEELEEKLNAGYAMLREIQQIKLFRMQCLWRAEQLKIEGVEASKDFRYWEARIGACPFLEPIIPEEVEAYAAYLVSESYEESTIWEPWQEFERYRAENSYPAWYLFFLEREDSLDLLQLPDLRGKKEAFYIAKAKSAEIKKADVYSADESIRKPWLNPYADGVIEAFMQRFEPDNMRRYSRLVAQECERRTHAKCLEVALQILKKAGRKVAVQENENWEEAIIVAASQVTKTLEIENLLLAFDEYQMRRQAGIADPQYKLSADSHFEDAVQRTKHLILKGRGIAGEPKTFDF